VVAGIQADWSREDHPQMQLILRVTDWEVPFARVAHRPVTKWVVQLM